MKLKQIVMIVFAVLFLLHFGAALEAADVSISFDKEVVALGDYILMSLALRGVPDDMAPPALPEISGIKTRYLGVKRESFSSFSIVIQGKQVQTDRQGGRTIFEYSLEPQKVGKQTIPSFSLVIDGAAYQTEPRQIEVLDEIKKSDDVFVVLEADKREAYLGERVVITFDWYMNKNIEGYSYNVPWLEEADKFVLQDPELDKGKKHQGIEVNGHEVIAQKGQASFQGKPYSIIRFRKILFPASEGALTLDPVFLRGNIIVGYQKARQSRLFDSFFSDDFFGFDRKAITEAFSARSDPLSIKVLGLPRDNVPVSFGGGVGVFDYSVWLEPEELRAGDPLTATMTVSGQGNIRAIEPPLFPSIDGFRSYDPEISVDIKEADGQLSGKKIFKKMYIPSSEGTFEFPSLSFAYFDVQERKYKEIVQGPFELKVTPGEKGSEPTIPIFVSPGSSEAPKELEVIGKDIVYIKSRIGQYALPKKDPRTKLLLLFVFLGLPLLYALLWVISSNRARLRSDVSYARAKRAARNAKKELRESARMIKVGNVDNFGDHLSGLLKQYMADKLNRPAALIGDDIADELLTRGLEPRICGSTRTILNKLDFMRFTNKKIDPSAMKDLYSEVRGIIKEMENAL